MIETSLSLPLNLFYDNDIDINVYVNIDLSNYKIRADIINQYSSSLALANEAADGSDDEIEFVSDGTDGKFIIHIGKNTINSPIYISYLEIEIEDEDEKVQTIYYAPLNFKNMGGNSGCCNG
jgi:hypothetical protein